MNYVLVVIAGIAAGIIGATFLYENWTQNNYYDNKSCFICKRKKKSHFLISLPCGHRVHESCIYDKLCKADLKNYRCPSCWPSEPVPYYFIENILCSRCCVCANPFDSETIRLHCGHKLHKKCLEADILRQLIAGERYECPYKLLKCNKEMDIRSLGDF